MGLFLGSLFCSTRLFACSFSSTAWTTLSPVRERGTPPHPCSSLVCSSVPQVSSCSSCAGGCCIYTHCRWKQACHRGAAGVSGVCVWLHRWFVGKCLALYSHLVPHDPPSLLIQECFLGHHFGVSPFGFSCRLQTICFISSFTVCVLSFPFLVSRWLELQQDVERTQWEGRLASCTWFRRESVKLLTMKYGASCRCFVDSLHS